MAGTSQLPEQNYQDDRPLEIMAKAHERVRTRKPSLIHELARVATGIVGFLFLRMRPIRARYVWKPGAVIIAPAHFSNLDHFIVGWFTWHRVHFMAKSPMFKGFLIKFFPSGGTFPVMRGRDDKEALYTARNILWRARALIMYCWGGRNRKDRLPEQAKWGIGWVALETGARIVPAAIYNSDHIRDWKHDWIRGKFYPVTVEYGKPMRFTVIKNPTRDQAQWAADLINQQIVALQEDLEARQGKRHPRICLAVKTVREECRWIAYGDARLPS